MTAPEMSQQSLADIVRSLDQSILNDPSLDPDLFSKLTTSQRELGLLQGERPTCPFLRPHILARSQYTAITRAAEIIATAFEKLVARALVDDDLFSVLGLTEAEARVARIDPGYPRLCVTSRLDAYRTETEFRFLEYNAESPAGVGDQMQLEKLLFPLEHIQSFLNLYPTWTPRPHEQLLKTLIETYRAWGGEEENPQIAIVDWKGVPTESEFAVLQGFFESEGYRTVVIDPDELDYDGAHLSSADFRIDIVYKRVIIHEFLERFDEHHPLIRAYTDRQVCMANSFRTKAAHKKAGFAVLSDPKYLDLFDQNEVDVIGRHIPWTRNVRPGKTYFEGAERDLFELIRSERQRMVLKPNDDYGGYGVFLGWAMDDADWNGALELAQTKPYVVQERAPLQKVSLPTFTEGLRQEDLYIDFNPFLFNNRAEGALIRLSSSALLNVTSGGGETALLVLEGM